MTKKTKKSPARKSHKKTAVDLETTDWVHLGKGTLSIRAMTDAEKAEVASSTEHQLAALRKEVDTLLAVAGGFWTTLDGTLLSIRQMSDNHLKNALLMPTLTETSRGLLLAEANRREIDQNYAKRDGRRSSNDEIHALGEKIDADAPTVAEVKFMQQVQNDLKLMGKQIDTLERVQRVQTLRLQGAEKTIIEHGMKVDFGTFDECLAKAKANGRLPNTPLQPFEVNGFRLSANMSGRWFARKGEVVLSAPSLEEVIELVKKVTS